MTATATQVTQLVSFKDVEDADSTKLKTLWAMVFDGKRKYPKDSVSKIRQAVKGELRRLSGPTEVVVSPPGKGEKAKATAAVRETEGGVAPSAGESSATAEVAGASPAGKFTLVDGTRFAVRESRGQHYVVDANGEEVVGPYDAAEDAAAAARHLQAQEAAKAAASAKATASPALIKAAAPAKATASPALIKAAAPAKAAAVKKPSTADYIRGAIRAGEMTPKQIAEGVRAAFSASKATEKDVYWHAWKLKQDGEAVPPWPKAEVPS